MLSITMNLSADGRHVAVLGAVDIHCATEFQRILRQLGAAVGGRTHFDLGAVRLLDDAARSAVRTFIRETQEFGGTVTAPQDGACSTGEGRIGLRGE